MYGKLLMFFSADRWRDSATGNRIWREKKKRKNRCIYFYVHIDGERRKHACVPLSGNSAQCFIQSIGGCRGRTHRVCAVALNHLKEITI